MSDVLTLRAVEVTDGDTFKAAGSGGNIVTVRVWGIDAPESGQPYGPPATRAAREIIGGSLADLHVQDTGPYGRYIARVQTEYNGKRVDLAQTLAVNGLAWYSRDYGTSDVLMQNERAARQREKGLWAQSDPTPPWAYREQQGETSLLEAIEEGYNTAREGYRWARWFWRLFS